MDAWSSKKLFVNLRRFKNLCKYLDFVKSLNILFEVSIIVTMFMTGCHHEDDIRVTFIGNSCIERWDLNR